MKDSTNSKIEDIQFIKETLECAHSYINNDLDAICDDDLREEAESILESIDGSLKLVDKYL